MTVLVSCASCGVSFQLTDGLHAHRASDGGDFYCPNGHVNVYRPTADQKKIAELERTLERRDAWNERLVADLNEAYASREDLIGALKECPGQCGWRSRRRIPRDPVAMGRGIERVKRDVTEHLLEAHGARATATRELEAGA